MSGSVAIDRSYIEIEVTLSGSNGRQSTSPNPVDAITTLSPSVRAHRIPK
jgi:hypothetical protein